MNYQYLIYGVIGIGVIAVFLAIYMTYRDLQNED